MLGPSAASESGKPSAEAKRFLDETTGPDKPRVYRNAVLLLVPSKDGLELATARVRDYLAWEMVREDIKKQQKDGNVDPARATNAPDQHRQGQRRIPEAIKQAYCIVVTVSEKDEAQAFKITVTGTRTSISSRATNALACRTRPSKPRPCCRKGLTTSGDPVRHRGG